MILRRTTQMAKGSARAGNPLRDLPGREDLNHDSPFAHLSTVSYISCENLASGLRCV